MVNASQLITLPGWNVGTSRRLMMNKSLRPPGKVQRKRFMVSSEVPDAKERVSGGFADNGEASNKGQSPGVQTRTEQVISEKQ
jgi:hypothetical protein